MMDPTKSQNSDLSETKIGMLLIIVVQIMQRMKYIIIHQEEIALLFLDEKSVKTFFMDQKHQEKSNSMKRALFPGTEKEVLRISFREYSETAWMFFKATTSSATARFDGLPASALYAALCCTIQHSSDSIHLYTWVILVLNILVYLCENFLQSQPRW